LSDARLPHGGSSKGVGTSYLTDGRLVHGSFGNNDGFQANPTVKNQFPSEVSDKIENNLWPNPQVDPRQENLDRKNDPEGSESAKIDKKLFSSNDDLKIVANIKIDTDLHDDLDPEYFGEDALVKPDGKYHLKASKSCHARQKSNSGLENFTNVIF
jgi:hypothetical protein